MPMRTTDRIRSASRGSEAQLVAAMNGPDAKDLEFARALFANAPLVGIDFAAAAAHTSQETATPEGGPYSSVRYNRDLNVAGIGIPSNTTPQPFPIPSGEAAALIYLTCLNRLVEGTVMEPATWIGRMGEPAWRWITSVWAGHCAEAKAAGATVVVINDLCKHYRDAGGEWQATWAWNENAGNEIVAWGNRLFPKLDDQGTSPPPPGPPPVPSPVALTIRNGIISASNVNRPGVALSAGSLWVTWHTTGNTNAGADAEMHRKFVLGGGGESTVSFHFVVDDAEAIQLLPLNEIGWHAGDGCNDRSTDLGCFASVAIELCVNRDGNWAQAKRNLVQLTAAIMMGDARIVYGGTDPRRFSPTRIAPHQKWSGKYCPQQLLDEGSLPALSSQVAAVVGGTLPPPPPPTPTPPPPTVYPEGMDIDLARAWFGKVGEYEFSPGGQVSSQWIADGTATGEWPSLVAVDRFDTRTYFRMSNGRIYWRPNDQAAIRLLK